jgi:hypothetical protein
MVPYYCRLEGRVARDEPGAMTRGSEIDYCRKKVVVLRSRMSECE